MTDKRQRNIFATVLTYAAPSSNYRGESEENRTILQKITKDGHEYPVISPESMRNALREMLAERGLPCNRRRLKNEDQLAVEFKSYPDAEEYADDFLFGYMVADPKSIKAKKGKDAKRDSVLRMNVAVALQPYRFNATLHQSPKNVNSPWQNAATSALIHKEVAYTAFQYPFALAGADCSKGKGPEWTKALLSALGELNNVAGGHARSYFEMSPRSIVARHTTSLVAGFDTYGFGADGQFAELSRINESDLPGDEFWLGGEIVRKLPDDEREHLRKADVQLFDSPQKLLAALADRAFRN
jgi:CRISPR-associated protein Cst2